MPTTMRKNPNLLKVTDINKSTTYPQQIDNSTTNRSIGYINANSDS